MSIEKANQKVHPVETQWHHPILIKYGFKPLDKEKTGLVRSYQYEKGEYIIKCSTGVNCDHWTSFHNGHRKTVAGGYWSDLEPYLKENFNGGAG